MPITRPVYPIVFYFFLFLIPFAGPLILELDQVDRPSAPGASTLDWVIASLWSAAWIGSYVFIHARCSSWAVSYWDAIGAQSVALESGCVNITVIYIMPMLFLYHIKYFCVAVASLFLGRGMAQVATLDMVKNKLVRRFPYAEVRRMLKNGEVPGRDFFARFEKTQTQKVQAARGDDAADALAEAFEQMEDDHRGQ